eukprot:TRINITY_DN64183_c0_g1_i1.p1 TRINITY_DN64183_c0_g1~~TRINITY_DN64183_c0_g1_i1.p1  ORF type:complete len:353 (+),score=57.87 TRINITY_DN64183_c0_g1_i1:34-1092(+)
MGIVAFTLWWLRSHVTRSFRGGAHVLREVSAGLWCFGAGVALVLRPPVAGECVESTLRLLPFTAAATAFLWLICYPLRLPGWYVLTLPDALRVVAALGVALAQLFLSELSGNVFHAAFRVADPVRAAEVRNRDVIRGLRAEARAMVKTALVVLVLGVVLVMLTPVVGHFIVPICLAIGAMLLHSWLVVLTALLLAALVGIMFGSGYALLQPFIELGSRMDPLLAIVALVAAALGIVTGASLRSVLQSGSVFYYSSTLLTHRFLANFSQRLTSVEWTMFVAQNKWRICGFGVPVFVLVTYIPEAALVLLPAFHGAAARLLAGILVERDDSSRTRLKTPAPVQASALPARSWRG